MPASPSIISVLIGIAIDEGLIESVDVSISEFFPDISEDKASITIEHLLTMRTGIEWLEDPPRLDSVEGMFASENWVEFVLNQEQHVRPGGLWRYNFGVPHLLSAIIQEASGMTASEFATDRIFNPLGITSAEWHSDPQGVTMGGVGLLMSPRDLLKIGQLYLNGGEWEGRQIISEEWVNM